MSDDTGSQTAQTTQDPYLIAIIQYHERHKALEAVEDLVLELEYNDDFSAQDVFDAIKHLRGESLYPEPPLGSVVLDDDGNAWQSYRYGHVVKWRTAGGELVHVERRWRDFSELGPVRVLYTPVVKS